MQLDHTHIRIRERSFLDILELSLHVMRDYRRAILVTMVLGVVPFMLMNQLLIGWMADIEYGLEFPFQYLWNMMLLICLEGPLASAFFTAFFGLAVFDEKTRLSDIVMDVVYAIPKLLWVHGVIRLVIPVIALYVLLAWQGKFNGWIEILLVPTLLMTSCGIRAFRPFINEIVILERNPLKSNDPSKITVKTRSQSLHGPNSGELFARWLASVLFAILLFGSVFGGILGLSGPIFHDWLLGPVMVTFVYPLSIWFLVGFFSVVRFLSYLDTRIRLEGWEVELKLRALEADMKESLT